MPPTIGQLGVLLGAVVLFVFGGVLSIIRQWVIEERRERMRLSAKGTMYLGLVAAVIVIVWHSVARGQWQPMRDNFEALVWLGVLLTIFVIYMQRARPIPGLDWFVMPIVVVLLIAAGVFGKNDFHEYRSIGQGAWVWVHRVTAYGGAAAFAVAAAGGTMYMIASRRLRNKALGRNPLGSLERLEHLMMLSVTLGFSLLTIGLITGIVWMAVEKEHTSMSKVLLASLAWVVYAVVMHAPINPRFRGRKAALLSVLGFVLMVGTIVAVQRMPGGNG